MTGLLSIRGRTLKQIASVDRFRAIKQTSLKEFPKFPRTHSGLFCFIVCLWLSVLALSCTTETNFHSNLLAGASSPYLREHADNPVHWQEWNDETLAFAAKENKPIIISIGYASCHWCHVMERETFMDTAVARVMNENFVCIKVDREERPDLDQVFIEAAELTSGNAGWPLNAFALPDGRPIFAATYFPKEYWSSLLTQVSTAFRDDLQNLQKQAQAIRDNINERDSLQFGIKSAQPTAIRDFIDKVPLWNSSLDLANGGLKGSTKFPMAVISEFILQYSYLTGDPASADWLRTTLEEMAYGGIYDQVGGGFARYTTDSLWRVPHFEKMLYDNGQLVSLYAHAFQATGDSLYLRIVNETLSFVSAELTSPDGAFYSSINADSEGEEGKYYLWSDEEIRKVVGPVDAGRLISMYSMTKTGNWEKGNNILYVESTQRNEREILKLDQARKTLAIARASRTRPTTDEKILTSWNAIMLNGYLDAFQAGGDTAHLGAALRNAEFLSANLMGDDGKIQRNSLGGQPGVAGFLEDYAWTSKAFIHLYQVTFDKSWLDRAKKLTDVAIMEFGSADNALYFFAPKQLSNPISRKMEVYDNVMPASNSVFAEVLFALGEYFQQEEYTKKATDAVMLALQEDPALGPYVSSWARLAQVMDEKPFEVAITGSESVMYARELQRRYLPSALFMGGSEENLPLLENKLKSGTTIYVCRDRVCKQPTSEIREALVQLGQN